MNLERLRPYLGRMADGLGRLGLSMAAFRAFEWLQSLGAPRDADLPPAYYRVLTTGIADPEAYVAVGRRAAQQILSLASQAGLALDQASRVLEFGCGCGRVSRVLAGLTPARLHGCDLHRGMVRWCQGHVRGAYAVTKPQPPLPYAPDQFDLVYALSVFTHMSLPHAQAWLAEMARITRPGGLAILSFLDEMVPAAEPFRDLLLRDGFFLKRAGTEGSNLMVGFFTADGFAEHAGGAWRRLSYTSSDASGSHQAMMVFQRA